MPEVQGITFTSRKAELRFACAKIVKYEYDR